MGGLRSSISGNLTQYAGLKNAASGSGGCYSVRVGTCHVAGGRVWWVILLISDVTKGAMIFSFPCSARFRVLALGKHVSWVGAVGA